MSTSRETGICRSITEVIGNTPLLELSRICEALELDGRILAKLDYLNPGASKKDRIALQMVQDAEADGSLKPGQTVVELTSGNTGAGLAMVCHAMGHPFVAVMSRGNTVERAVMMRGLGAEVVLVDQMPGSMDGQVSGADLELVNEETRRIIAERGAFRADQFELDGALRVHELCTGAEILRQAGHIDAFCDFAGTCGTFTGCATCFKEHDLAIKCYLIEPATSPALAGGEITDPGHCIQGGGYSRRHLTHFHPEVCDGFISVTNAKAIEMTRMLGREEGIFAGFSSGANLAGAISLLRGPCRGATVAMLVCDSGLKYLSTDLWESQ